MPVRWRRDPPGYFPAFALLLCAQLGAADAPGEADWRTPDPANLLYMELPGGRVIIELAPAFAPGHVGNIRTLAREHFWDGTSIDPGRRQFRGAVR